MMCVEYHTGQAEFPLNIERVFARLMKVFKNAAGPVIGKLRYGLGLSQTQLAIQCQKSGWDISRDIVARIENQTRWIADTELVVLAKVLSVPVQKLCGKPEDCLRLLQKRHKNHG